MRAHINSPREERSDKGHKGGQYYGENPVDNVVDNEDRTGRPKLAGSYKVRWRWWRTTPSPPFTSSSSPSPQRSSLNLEQSIDIASDDGSEVPLDDSSSQSEDDFQLKHSLSQVTAPSPDDDSDSGISLSDTELEPPKSRLSPAMPYIESATSTNSSRPSWENIKPATFATFPRSCTNHDEEFKIRTIHFKVPLEHHKPSGQQINIHTELIFDSKHRDRFENWFTACRASPILLFLCGGPGDKNPHDRMPEFNKIMVEKGYVILYADYRGTGQSHKIDTSTVSSYNAANDIVGAAEYLSLFRQDNIVRDLEAIRLCLTQYLFPFHPQQQQSNGDGGLKWTLMGQSYGGWVALTYLSFLPGSLAKVYLTAGLAPVVCKSPDEVYEALYGRMRGTNERFYQLYPGDVVLVREVYNTLLSRGLSFELPDGSGRKLTAQTFLTLGRKFIGGDSGLKAVHEFVGQLHAQLVRNSVIPPSREVLTEFSELEGFKLHSRPLYGVLHEAIYCNNGDTASDWSALRVGKRYPEYKGWLQGKYVPEGQRLFFSGEMVLPYLMPEEFRLVGDAVAKKGDWEPLYDLERLKENTVPMRAMAYRDDLAVDFELSKQTVEAVKGCVMVVGKPGWGHGSLRNNTDEVIEMLF
ncbi:Alpha/Beta hydrolase protein [Apiosordaria backusii]|uniref:Alpha/Beta hydrolase protein n=1 Tax=Apiosordaria backusii TaxID=314023 RepID=A0AA39ZRR7_9PEZI|nr:Alpha/Beta hydrolase protein [Apiosordaria backusii]